MSPTRDFVESVRERAEKDPAFKGALLREALSCILNGELSVGRILLCDYVEAVIGFAEAARRTGQSQESLTHMLSPGGNAQADDLLGILVAFAEHDNIELDVPAASRSRPEQPASA